MKTMTLRILAVIIADETFLESRVKSRSLKVKTNRGRKEVTHLNTILFRIRLFRMTKSELDSYTF